MILITGATGNNGQELVRQLTAMGNGFARSYAILPRPRISKARTSSWLSATLIDLRHSTQPCKVSKRRFS
jgi:uncharacterized protein YbjT (DUF2867 family)